MLGRWLQQQWFQRRLTPALWLLMPLFGPLCLLYLLLSRRRRQRCHAQRLPVPVIVVGNLTVGGAGKTPLTLWLAGQLQTRGWQPGIVSRGHGGQTAQPRPVLAASTPAEVGDEPLLLARRSGRPVWVGQQRAAAAAALLARHPEVDLLLCDDGLQHHALARDVELVVIDRRGLGNGWCLPLGPLRETPARLPTVDALIGHDFDARGLDSGVPDFAMRLQATDFYRLDAPAQRCTAADLLDRRLYALAGIGDPERFFNTLRGLGLSFTARPFADHQAYVAADLAFAADGVLLMTEKDAVKCAGLTTGEAWVLPVEADVSPALIDLILEKLRGCQAA
ncbi:MAG: tetraacyldisaccharide 4'-kinase [Dechloromonas sp.]|nr:tetraacyldisaccharide 4'-kinase [Dechloromonas sp.]